MKYTLPIHTTFSTLFIDLDFIQGHSSVKPFQLKILCSNPIKLKLSAIVDYIK